MSGIRLDNSNHVRYFLQSDTSRPIKLQQEPGGWADDELEIIRHDKYHGVFTQFTNALKFRGEAKEYIKTAFEIGGLNTNLYLIKEALKEKIAPNRNNQSKFVKWETRYIGIADFETLKEAEFAVEIKFNSNNLETLIKAHEGDVFEIDREDSIDSKAISPLVLDKVYIKGRTLITRGESNQIQPPPFDPYHIWNIDQQATVPTVLVSRGNIRHVSVDTDQWPYGDPLALNSNMFWVDSKTPGETVEMALDYHVRFSTYIHGSYVMLYKYSWDGGTYVQEEVTQLHYGANADQWYEFQGRIFLTVEWNEGLLFAFLKDEEDGIGYNVKVPIHNLKLNIRSFYEPSPDLSFVFVDRCLSRLMEILTGKRKKFYSKLFGRANSGSPSEYPYLNDGEYGLIALISGFWVRAFNPLSENYKGLQTNLTKMLESLQAVFNVGISIESINFVQRLRVEDLKYFYQEEVVVRLPYQISNVKREVDKTMYFSGVEIGYNKGGDYENEVGLDEPNTKTSYVTPIHKTPNKYIAVSDVRSDEYGLEITRRKPEFLFPDEDTNQDEHNWFLDLKRSDGYIYQQNEWDDRLVELPTGILSPETYKSMLFTPRKMLERHGWILRAGMNEAINLVKKIKYISSVANSTLSTWFIGDPAPIAENSDIVVNKLETPKFIPEEVTFNHTVDDTLLDLIMGTTKIMVNGEVEDVPNAYFKMEYLNEYGEYERGYLLGLKPKITGEFRMTKCNELLNNKL